MQIKWILHANPMGCGLVSKSPRTWVFLSGLPAPPCSKSKTVRPPICRFYPPVCKFSLLRETSCANSEYTHVTCEHLVSPNSFISSRFARRTWVLEEGEPTAFRLGAVGPDWWQHCYSSLCPWDSVSFHSDSKACRLTQTHRVVVQSAQLCSTVTHHIVTIKWRLVCAGTIGFIASATVL